MDPVTKPGAAVRKTVLRKRKTRPLQSKTGAEAGDPSQTARNDPKINRHPPILQGSNWRTVLKCLSGDDIGEPKKRGRKCPGKRAKAAMEGPEERKMAHQKILTLWDEEQINEEQTRILRTPCSEVPAPFDEETKKAVRTLREAFLERDDAAGLAAPQIGIGKRIIAFRCRESAEEDPDRRRGEFEILVNPRITQRRGDPVIADEGCLSCPEIRVEISRHPEIKVRGFDAEGKKVSKRYLDFAARVVQHEVDHLDGKLIVDYEGSVFIPKKRQDFFERFFQGK
jgi:peptide deformylase